MNIWGNDDGRLAGRGRRSIGRTVGDLADRRVELAILRNEAGKEREGSRRQEK